MNLGIQQTSRSRKSSTQKNPSLQHGGGTLESMAKAFGVDVSSFGDQAESMWTMLNELHDSDPASYDSFIQQQIEEMNSVKDANFIIPEKGFVVKAFVNARYGSAKPTTKLFVNFCHHKVVKLPVDAHGAKVSETTENLINGEIPMVISSLRDLKDASGIDSQVIDIVLNPWCLSKSSNNVMFKSEVISLGLKSIMEERKISLQSKWKLIRSTYKGGIGKNMDVHPFPIDTKLFKRGTNNVKENTHKSDDTNVIIDNPQTLLQSLRCDNDSHSDIIKSDSAPLNTNSKPALIQEINTTVEPKRKLIEEIDSTRRCSKTIGKETSSQTIQSGFLNNNENYKALYKEPSTGDGNKGTGGSYSKLMSKCQVVDAASLVPPKSAPSKEDKVGIESGLKKGFLKNKKNLFHEDKPQRGDFDAEFNAIMKRADPSFACAFDDYKEDTISPDELDDTLKVLARGIENQQNSVYKHVGKELYVPIEPEQDVETKKVHSRRLPYKIDTSNEGLLLKVNLDCSQVSNINDIVVEICGDELTVSTSCGKQLKYLHPNIHDKVTAKFKPKAKELYLKFPPKV